MKTIAIIQARMTSSRLAGKILKDFSNQLNMLDMQLQTLQNVLDSKNIYIATTNNKSDDIVQIKYQNQCNVYRGDEEDVLSRFLNILKKSNADTVIRIASDNPFIFHEGINHLLHAHYHSNADYTTFSIENTPSMLVPCGLYVEIVSAHALSEVERNANKIEKEHVTYALYTRLKDNYNIQLLPISKYEPDLDNKNLRYTVDTLEDFNFINEIIQSLNIKDKIGLETIKKIILHGEENNSIEKMQKESNKTKNSKKYK